MASSPSRPLAIQKSTGDLFDHDNADPPPPNAPTTASPALRRTRFVLISDTHNHTPYLPPGDVLIHAGDLTNQGTATELSKTIKWLERADFEAKVIIAGNHDIALDQNYEGSFKPQTAAPAPPSPPDPEAQSLLTSSSPNITYLCHSSTTISLTSPRGPRTTFKVFGSPYSPFVSCTSSSPAFHPATNNAPKAQKPHSHPSPFTAFTYASPAPLHNTFTPPLAGADDLPCLWDQGLSDPVDESSHQASNVKRNGIPLDTDIVVTHVPPRGHLDEGPDRRPRGCEALRRALWRVRPRLAVCGHVHEARGAERVTWDLENPNAAFKAQRVETLAVGPDEVAEQAQRAGTIDEGAGKPWERPAEVGSKDEKVYVKEIPKTEAKVKGASKRPRKGGSKKMSLVDLTGRKGGEALKNDGGHGVAWPPSAFPASESSPKPPGANLGIGTRGLGGVSASLRSDVEALAGARAGRRETCVVNCAVMATSYPHVGGRKMNKAVVVDLELPSWDA